MNSPVPASPATAPAAIAPPAAGGQPIKIAILAMGGEGGGVLADWLVDLAEHDGWLAQTTSVPGVAQRTGATIYYVELFRIAHPGGPEPVLALMPLPGDVDVVIASELMEAARAVERGLVTEDRTLLIASTHRVYAIAERMGMGDARADRAALLATARTAARRFVGFDMARVAETGTSPIGAVLFGALAATGALPFPRSAYEAAIRRSGVGVDASLRAFAAGFEHGPDAADAADAAGTGDAADAAPGATSPPLPRAADPAVQRLVDLAGERYGGAARTIVLEGLRRLIDYQDPDYAATYLHRLEPIRLRDPDGLLTTETARHLALWMSYEDTIRVADLKSRDTRFARVRDEVKLGPRQLLAIDEYLHPRLQEICDSLPAGAGRWLLASGLPRRLVERLASKGRIVRTSSLRGFLLLRAIAGLRRFRRGSLRHQAEDARIRAWLADIAQAAARNVALATEIARCQRLVKGYGDTHARGLRHFEAIQAVWQRDGDALSPLALRALCDAALADEQGQALRTALARHETL